MPVLDSYSNATPGATAEFVYMEGGAAKNATPQQIQDSLPSIIVQADDYAAARALTTLAHGDQVSIAYRATFGDGGGGIFVYSTADLSAEVAADTEEGAYLSVTAGGVLTRAPVGYVSRSWFLTDAAFLAFADAYYISGDLRSTSIETAESSTLQSIAIGNGGVPGTIDSLRIGRDGTVLESLTTGYSLVAIGYEALKLNTTGYNNTAVGRSALKDNVDGINNTAVGTVALEFNTSGGGNTGVGVSALVLNETGNNNTGVGFKAGYSNTGGNNNTAVGTTALQYNISGVDCTAVGYEALTNSTANNNTALGKGAGTNITSGANNTAVGRSAVFAPGTGTQNTGVGASCMTAVAAYSNTTAVGYEALRDNTASGNTAIGKGAGTTNTTSSNCTFVGANTAVTGSNQVQLGDSATTTYVYGTVQNRSDERDKEDIQDTALGLEFIIKLRPVDYRWDYREDYEGGVRDGSKKRSRMHHGLIAQEVKAVTDALGIDFGGYQDHSIGGGADVLSIGYDELIAPLIRAIQELAAEVAALKAK